MTQARDPVQAFVNQPAKTLLVQAPTTPTSETVAASNYPPANFYSAGPIRPPLLPPGFNLNRARLTSLDLETNFPQGRQLVYVVILGILGEGIDRTTILDLINLDRFRPIIGDRHDHFQIILVKDPKLEWYRPPTNVDFTAEELQTHQNVDKLQGPWTVWVDTNSVVTKQISIISDPPTTRVTTQPLPSFSCVEDGTVIGSLDDYHIQIDDTWLNQVLNDCITGRLGDEWLPTPFGRGVPAPNFTLHDGSGGTLTLDDLTGRPFAILAPAPAPETPLDAPPFPFLRAPEPSAAIRLEQVRRGLDSAGLIDIPLIAIALPYHYEGETWDATRVVQALRDQLDVPVYEDATGTFLGNYSQFYGRTSFYNHAIEAAGGQNAWILVDSNGEIVDTFVDVLVSEGSDQLDYLILFLPPDKALKEVKLGE